MRDLVIERERAANPARYWTGAMPGRCPICRCNLHTTTSWSTPVWRAGRVVEVVITCGSHYCRAKGSATS